jgi:DnaJ-class molecular chaperone
MSKDYYAILGVQRNASEDDIKKAYRNMAMQYHPDRNPGKEEWANEKFKEINEAYGVLGNPEKRRQYDQFGTTGTANDIFGSQATSTTFEDLMKEFRGSGLNIDFLERIFGDSLRNHGFSFRVYRYGGGSPGGINLGDLFQQAQGRTQTQSSQIETVRYEITINKKDAKKGIEKDFIRNGHTLRVKIPRKTRDGTKIRMGNALHITDGIPGDIIISVLVKD